MKTKKPKPRGLAAVDIERRRDIARLGGLAAAAKGTQHVLTSKQRIKGGKKGGRAVAAIPNRMSEIGRLGGIASAAAKGTRKRKST